MANAFSQIHNYRDPVTDPNMQLTGQLLQYKQQKYDHNKAKLQSIFDEFSSIDLYKDVDKDYAENRLTQIKSLANKYMAGDLSSDALTSSIITNMDQFVDNKVVNGMVSTKRFKSDMSRWEELQTKKPELFDERNKEYALAKSDFLRWSNSEEAGDVYKGGFNVIEYTDVDANVLKELPKILKEIKSTWVETSPGSGMFYDNVTMEAVPREELGKALKLAIGDKGYKQLEINGWDEYRRLPPEHIANVNDTYFNQRIRQDKAAIQQLEQRKAKKSTPEEKELYNTLIEDRKKSIEQSSNRLSTKGEFDPERTYTSLFTQRYEDNILDAYSKEPREIKRELDKNHLETVKFQESQRRYEEKLAREAAKTAKEEADRDKVYVTDDTVIDVSTKELGTVLDRLESSIAVQTESFNNTFKDYSEDERKVLFTYSAEDLAQNNGKIEVNGKKIDLSADQIEEIVKYRDVVLRKGAGYDKIDEETGKYYEAIKEQYFTNWSRAENFSSGGSFIAPRTEVPNIKIVKNPSGDFRVVEEGTIPLYEKLVSGATIDNPSNYRNYKNTLTEEDEIEVDISFAAMVLADPNLDSATKREVRNHIVNKYEGKVDNISDLLEVSTATRPGWFDTPTSWVSKLIQPLMSDRYAPSLYSPTDYTPGAKEVKDLYLRGVEQAYDQYSNIISVKDVIVPSTHRGYTDLTSMLGVSPKADVPVTVSAVLEGGKPTGEYDVTYVEPTLSTGTKTVKVPITKRFNANMMAQVDLRLGERKSTPYSISEFGSEASSISIGTGAYSEDAVETYIRRSGDNSAPKAYLQESWSNLKEISEQYEPGSGAGIEGLYRDFSEGNIDFVVEPFEGAYHIAAYKDGNIIGRDLDVNLGTDLSYTEIANLLRDASLAYKSDAILNIAKRKVKTGTIKNHARAVTEQLPR